MMLTGKGKIRLALLIVAAISLGTTLLSLSYLHQMSRKIDVITTKDAKIAELGESISIKMLDARREEKNFIIYLDSTHIGTNKAILMSIRHDVGDAKTVAPEYTLPLDSIDILVTQYENLIHILTASIQEDPRALYRLQQQIINYQRELQNLAQKQNLKIEDLPSWTTDINVSLLSASTKLSTEKSRLFSELRETGNDIMELAKRITGQARESLTRNSEEGRRYSNKAQRNTWTILLLTGLMLAFLIFQLPHRIFLPYRKIGRTLKAIARGETQYSIPYIDTGDELGELSRSFEEAINKLHFFNELKSSTIAALQRNLHRILEEVNEAVLILTPDLTLIYLNQAARNLFGIDRNMVSLPIKEIVPLWEAMEGNIQDIEKRGRYQLNLRLKKKGIKKKIISIIPSIGSNGKLDNILIVIK